MPAGAGRDGWIPALPPALAAPSKSRALTRAARRSTGLWLGSRPSWMMRGSRMTHLGGRESAEECIGSPLEIEGTRRASAASRSAWATVALPLARPGRRRIWRTGTQWRPDDSGGSALPFGLAGIETGAAPVRAALRMQNRSDGARGIASSAARGDVHTAVSVARAGRSCGPGTGRPAGPADRRRLRPRPPGGSPGRSRAPRSTPSRPPRCSR